MSARRVPGLGFTPISPTEHLRLPSSVASLRDEWLAHGLRAEPSDRSAAEAAVAELYRLAGRPRPEFVWTPSPPAGASLLATEGISAGLTDADFSGTPAQIAEVVTGPRRRIDTHIARRRRTRFHRTDDIYAVVQAAVATPLRTSLIDGVAVAVRTLMRLSVGRITWYGQLEAHRVAYLTALRDLHAIRLSHLDEAVVETQLVLGRSTGWWWASDEVCVMSERPTSLHTELTPNAERGERRLHHSDSPAIEFADGSAAFVLHGTIVPEWVVADPTVERISTERSIEIRRCAIERIGWEQFIDAAGLTLIDRAADPGNPQNVLQLYATPRNWTGGGRILLAVNGSVERDGTRRRYGLAVPRHFTSALDAAGWTYGLRGQDYAQLARRT